MNFVWLFFLFLLHNLRRWSLLDIQQNHCTKHNYTRRFKPVGYVFSSFVEHTQKNISKSATYRRKSNSSLCLQTTIQIFVFTLVFNNRYCFHIFNILIWTKHASWEKISRDWSKIIWFFILILHSCALFPPKSIWNMFTFFFTFLLWIFLMYLNYKGYFCFFEKQLLNLLLRGQHWSFLFFLTCFCNVIQYRDKAVNLIIFLLYMHFFVQSVRTTQ